MTPTQPPPNPARRVSVPGTLSFLDLGEVPKAEGSGGITYNKNMATVQLPIPRKEIAAFCKRWKVVELCLARLCEMTSHRTAILTL
jgi:hypothetical protein